MASEYIERDLFLSCKRNQYCMNCERRKNSKGKIVYAIGDAPCRACGIGDVLDDEDSWYNRMPADGDYCSHGEKRWES